MGNVTTEQLESIGFTRCNDDWIQREGHEIWFYDEIDYWVHFDQGQENATKYKHSRSADCTLKELIASMFDDLLEDILDGIQDRR